VFEGVAQNRMQQWAMVNIVINLKVAYMAGNFSTR